LEAAPFETFGARRALYKLHLYRLSILCKALWGCNFPKPFILKTFKQLVMKKFSRIVVGTFILILISSIFSSLPGAITHEVHPLVSYESFKLEKLTIYNPHLSQCDADPLTTASNKKINLNKLKSGSLRWMAVSRNMLERWGGKLSFGDTVRLHVNDQTIDGEWIIQDTMNKRFENRGDLLFDADVRSAGMWSNVTIVKQKMYLPSLTASNV
jgi:hypothetical protein